MQTIAEKFPELIKEWHPTKNGEMTPFNTACFSNKSAVWVCGKGHVWEARIANRSKNGVGCPCCAGKKACNDNSLTQLFPSIAKQWDSIKNGKVTPDDVPSGSNKKYWWKCECGYRWIAEVKKRTMNGNGCPNCAGKVINSQNSLAINYPELAEEWDYEANYPLTPDKIMSGSRKIVSWKCRRGHLYEMRVGHRTTGHGCKFCNNQTSRLQLFFYSELKALLDNVQYKIRVEGVECDIYLPDYKIGIEVDGFYWHQGNDGKDKIKADKLANNGVRLINIRENGLLEVSGDTVRFNKNDDKFEISKKLMELLGTIIDNDGLRTYKNNGKPINEKYFLVELVKFPAPVESHRLSTLSPIIANEWDYERNFPLTPDDVSNASGIKVWFKCEFGHSWMSAINNRTSHKQGCPECWKIRHKNLHRTKIS